MLIIVTILFILGGACLSSVLFQMIQVGQILGFWQNVLEALYAKGWTKLEMFLGGCYKCFGNFIGHITFGAYLLFQYYHDWIGWWNVLVYFFFIPSVITFHQLLYSKISKSEKENELLDKQLEE